MRSYGKQRASPKNIKQEITVGLTEITLLALPLFAALVVVLEDSKVERKK